MSAISAASHVPSELPDAQVDWLAQLASGSDAALSRLIAAWGPALHRFAYRYLNDAALADDVVQETFVRVYQQRSRYRPGGSPTAWLFTIAANLCHNQRRWRGRHATVPLLNPGEREADTGVQDVASPGRSPAERAVQEETIVAVRSAIDALPHEMKTTLLLFEYDDLAYEDIAKIVGCSARGVETRLTRARARLRKSLGRIWQDLMEVEPSSSVPGLG